MKTLKEMPDIQEELQEGIVCEQSREEVLKSSYYLSLSILFPSSWMAFSHSLFFSFCCSFSLVLSHGGPFAKRIHMDSKKWNAGFDSSI